MLLLHIEIWPYLSALETSNALSRPELAKRKHVAPCVEYCLAYL